MLRFITNVNLSIPIVFINQVTAICNIILIIITTITFPYLSDTNIIELLQIFTITIWMKPSNSMIGCYLVVNILLIQVVMCDINCQLYNFR